VTCADARCLTVLFCLLSDRSVISFSNELGFGHRENLTTRANLPHAYHATGPLKRASAHFDRALATASGPSARTTRSPALWKTCGNVIWQADRDAPRS
jgi:hypothetical protein